MTATLFAPAASKTFWVRRDTKEKMTILPVIGWKLDAAGASLPVVPGVVDTSGPFAAVVCADYELDRTLAANLASGDDEGDVSAFHGIVVDLAFGKPFWNLEEWIEWCDFEGHVPTASKPNSARHPALNFSGKVYLKSSFWQVAIPGKPVLIFTLPGGSAAPVDLFVTKITRDEFFAARKVHTEVPHLALVGGAPAESPEEDDDADDLI